MTLHSPSSAQPSTSHHASTVPLRKAPLFTPYVVIWTTFGALSLGLLGVLGLAPELLADLKPTWTITDPQSNQGQRAAARLAADINALKDSVAKIQLDLAKVKTEVAAQGEQDKLVAAQVTALEVRASAGTSLATTTATVVTPEQQAAAAVPTAAPAAGTPAPARAPKVINADAATAPAPTPQNGAALETGSVATAAKALNDPISFGPAVVKAAPQPMGVKISTGASADSLRLSWSLLSEKHGDTLRGLEARFVTGGDAQNPNYDLIAGPIKSKAEASKLCKALTAKGVACSVGAFAGEAL
jgi:hypothetical protein